jgi:hypothetical protein
VQLINTDGMVVIGPGSEWLWNFLSGVALVVTFIAIYRQLRLQRSAGAIEHLASLKREWDSEGMARSVLATLLAIRDGCDPTHLPAAADDIGDFWQRVGYMVKAGDVDRHLVHEYLSAQIRAWWVWLAPTVRSWREREGLPFLYGHFEWLAGHMAEMDRKAGRTMAFDEGTVARSLAASIDVCLHQIRTGEELRSVIVRPGSPGTFTSEPAPSAAAPGVPPGR